MFCRVWIVALFVAPSIWASSIWAEETATPAAADVRQAVERALPYLEKEGLAWMQARKCVACHHSAFMLWGFHEAKRSGLAVDDAKLEELTRQSFELMLANQKTMLAKKNGGVEAAHLLLSQVGVTPPKTEEVKALTEILVNAQQADGSFKYEGQGLKRPDDENNLSTTQWAALAFDAALEDSGKEARGKALEWLKAQTAEGSHELLITKLLLAERAGEQEQIAALVKELRSQQNADGGWSWTKDRPSEAYATGETLYALARSGVGESDESIQRGRKYLLDSQQSDGSWQSPSRKPKGGVNPISAYWGTAWAVIGLARTLPVSN